jgi:hypothetical protein
LKNIFIMTTEKIVIGGILLTAAAIRTIITDLIVPLVAMLLTLAGWRPALSAAAAPAQAEEPRRRLALAPEPVAAPTTFPTPRAVLEGTNVKVLRRMAQQAGVPRETYNFAKKDGLIQAILAATPDRGGAGRASG